VLANLVLLAGGLFMCFLTSWRLTLLTSTLIGPVVWLSNVYARWSKKLNMKSLASVADANGVATEAMGNIRTVRSFGAEHIELGEYTGHLDTSLRYGMKDAFASSGLRIFDNYLNYAATALILWYGGLATLRSNDAHELSIGKLITFSLYWNMLNRAIKGLTGLLNTLIRAGSSAQRVFEIIDLQPDIPLDQGLSVGVNSSHGVGPLSLELRDVDFSYQMRSSKQVLSQLSFTVPAGHTVALVGRSGAGKTTIVNMLLRFYDPQGGELLVDGRPMCEYSLNSVKKHVGVVSQDTQVFCRSIRDNLTYGLSPEEVTEEMVEEASRMANAHDFIMEVDGGYSGMIGERGVQLSGGQRQRLAIARAFLRRPRLLLLDEATSALDAENEGKVQEALDQMMASVSKRCTVILIAHRLSTVINADKIIVLDKGTVAEQGTHAELLQHNRIYASLVKRQLQKQSNLVEDSEDYFSGKGKGGQSQVPDDIDNLFDADGPDDRAKGNDKGKAKEKGKGKEKGKKGKEKEKHGKGSWEEEDDAEAPWWKGKQKGDW